MSTLPHRDQAKSRQRSPPPHLFRRCIRVAQQFALLASLPSIAVTTLVGLNVIKVSLVAGLVAAAALLLLNRIGWRFVSAMFDREQLIIGTK